MSDIQTLFLISAIYTIVLLQSVKLRDAFNPNHCLLLPIVGQYWLYFFSLSKEYSVNPWTNVILITAITSFVAGSIFVDSLPRRQAYHIAEYNIRNSLDSFRNIEKPFLWIGVFGFILGTKYAFDHGLTGPSNFFFNLRYANTIEHAPQGVFPYLLIVLHVVVLYRIVHRTPNQQEKGLTVLLSCLLIISSMFTMARTALLMYIISFIGAYSLSNRHIYQKKTKKKLIAYMILGFLAISIAFAALTNKILSGNNFFIVEYIGRPIIAFDQWILNSSIRTDGFITLYPVLKIGEALDLYHPPNMDLGLSRSDFNVFTFLQGPYLDFGYTGVLTIPFTLGVACWIIYNRAASGRVFHLIYYSILLYPLSIAFYAYQFGLSSWTYYLGLLVFIYLFRKIRITSNKVSFVLFSNIKVRMRVRR